MKNAPTLRTLFCALLLCSLLAACAATQLNPGAQSVLVTHQPAPAGCVYLGTVIGEQGGSLTGGLTSNKNLAQGAINDMKNKAAELGANYVVLEDTRAGNTISGGNGSISGQQTDVTHMGNAFRCGAQPPPPVTPANAVPGT